MCQLLPIFLGEDRVLVAVEAAGFIYLNCEGISVAMGRDGQRTPVW